jgi:hypothetical protein
MDMKLSSLRANGLILRQLRWDVTPEFLFKPRFAGVGKERDRDMARETQGYMFYIDYINGEARLMLMRTIEMMSQTVGQVTEVPEDMLLRSVKAEGVKPVAGMYPISAELEAWLKKELGVASS